MSRFSDLYSSKEAEEVKVEQVKKPTPAGSSTHKKEQKPLQKNKVDTKDII